MSDFKLGITQGLEAGQRYVESLNKNKRLSRHYLIAFEKGFSHALMTQLVSLELEKNRESTPER